MKVAWSGIKTKRQKEGRRLLAEADRLDRSIAALERKFQRQQEAREENHVRAMNRLRAKRENLRIRGNAYLMNQTVREYMLD